MAADRPVAIGVIGYSNSGAALSGLGVSGIDTGDNAAEAKAVVRYLNAHGGLDGHQISIAVHLENTESLIVNDSSEEQAACTDLTRDHHVFAVVSIASTAIGLGCFAHAHVPMISDAIEPTIAQERSDDGYYYGPSDINMDREYQDMVDGLYRGGFFGQHSKIGVLLWGPDQEPILNGDIKPALARHGLAVADSFEFGNSAGEDGDAQQAALRFKTEGITNVMEVATSPLFFMESAQNERYYPAYGLDSGVAPGALLEGNAPAAQLQHTMAVGWMPTNDLDSGHQSDVISSSQALCRKIQHDAGNSEPASTHPYSDTLCDELLTLAQSLSNAPGVSVTTLADGYYRLGNSHISAITFESQITPGRPDGIAAYRLVVYNDSCSCFVYRGGKQPMP